MSFRTLIVFSLAFMVVALPVRAYIDPGTGSMFLQLILGGVAGALVAGKLFWRKLASLVSFRRGRKEPVD